MADWPWPAPDDEPWEPEDPEVKPPELQVDITDPQVVGYLYGPDGEPIATLLDRPTVPFGFRR